MFFPSASHCNIVRDIANNGHVDNKWLSKKIKPKSKILQKVAAETTPCSLFVIVRGGIVWCWLFDTSRHALIHRLSWQLFSSHIFRESDWNELSARSWNGQFIRSLEMADWRHYLVLFAWVPGVRKKEHHNRCAFKTTVCAQGEHNKRHMSVTRHDALTSDILVLTWNHNIYMNEISHWIFYSFEP